MLMGGRVDQNVEKKVNFWKIPKKIVIFKDLDCEAMVTKKPLIISFVCSELFFKLSSFTFSLYFAYRNYESCKNDGFLVIVKIFVRILGLF